MSAQTEEGASFTPPSQGEFSFPSFRGEIYAKFPPEEWIFDTLQEYERFSRIVTKLYDEVLGRFRYNTISSFLSFYKEFKESDMSSLQWFYYTPFRVEFSTRSLSSIGLCVVFKRELERVLQNGEFDKIRDHLYYAAGCVTPSDVPKANIEEEDGFWLLHETELIALVLKFNVGPRRGHFLVNFDYGLNQPLVVMEDADEPHSQTIKSFSWAGWKSHTARYLNGRYILRTVQESTRKEYHVFYVHLGFLRLDYAERRLKVNPMQAVMTYVDGKPNAGYCSVTGIMFGEISAFTSAEDQHDSVVVSYGDAFLDENVNDLLKGVVEMLGGDAKEQLAEFVALCSDKKFTSDLWKIHRKRRSTTAGLWNKPPLDEH